MLAVVEAILKETNNGKDITQIDIPRIKYRLDKAFAELDNDKLRKTLAPIVMRDELVRFLFRDPESAPPVKQPPKPASSYWVQDGGRDY